MGQKFLQFFCNRYICSLYYTHTHDFLNVINSFQRGRTVQSNDYSGMRTLPGNFFFSFIELERQIYWNFYLHFSFQYHPWITHLGQEYEENDH